MVCLLSRSQEDKDERGYGDEALRNFFMTKPFLYLENAPFQAEQVLGHVAGREQATKESLINRGS